MNEVHYYGDYHHHNGIYQLQDLRKFAAAVETGGEAKLVIQEGDVTVNGEVCTMRGKKIRPGDVVAFNGQTLTVTYES